MFLHQTYPYPHRPDGVPPRGHFWHTECAQDTCKRPYHMVCPPFTVCHHCGAMEKNDPSCPKCQPRSVIVKAVDGSEPQDDVSKHSDTQPPAPQKPLLSCIALPPRLSDREEHRLLYGNEYVSLPENYEDLPDNFHVGTDAGRGPNVYAAFNDCHPSTRPECKLPPEPEADYIKRIRQRNEDVQQMEATNRWKLIESQTPAHNVGALRRKMALSSGKHSVDVFYDHEGRYQHERVGLYKTSYDPRQLAAAMNAEQRCCGAIGDTTAIERGSLDLPTSLNGDMTEALGRCRALCGSVPRHHNLPSVYEVIRPLDIAKHLQKRHINPEPPAVGVRPQEKELVWTHETTYQGDYNTRKFLQENPYPIAMHARNEPFQVMSSVNQDLKQVRPFCRVPDSGKFAADDEPEISCCDVKKTSVGSMRTLAASLALLNCPEPEERQNQLAPVVPHCQYDLSHIAKNVKLLEPWKGCLERDREAEGCVSRCQTLIRFNDGYNSAGVPDLRRNIRTGRKHQFAANINSQVMRGTTIPGF